MENKKARILFFDEEVSPILAWTYGLWQTNVIKVEEHSHMFCFSYKWLEDKDIKCISQIDFPARFKADPNDDTDVIKALWSLLDEADIVVGHNARGFDVKVAMGRFLVKGMTPPSPFKTIDTLTVARSRFKFASNRLGELCKELNIGDKSEETHSDLWYDCLKGDKEAWDKMITYCKNDTYLLEKLYLKVRPYIFNHPNLAVISQRPDTCPKCGHDRLQRRGLEHTNTMTYYRFKCMNCGGWVHERVYDRDSEKPTYKN